MPTLSLLPRAPARAMLPLLPDAGLAQGRVHEICGPARRSLALWIAGLMQGPVIWIRPAWQTDRLHPEGVYRFVDPARILTVSPERAEDLLWVMEEALRDGCVPLVVGDLIVPPALTPVRRLHLAAEQAVENGGRQAGPLGLLLCPGDGGAQGVESRWHMAPAHEPGRERWHVQRRRARAAPPRAWVVAQDRPRAAPRPVRD